MKTPRYGVTEFLAEFGAHLAIPPSQAQKRAVLEKTKSEVHARGCRLALTIVKVALGPVLNRSTRITSAAREIKSFRSHAEQCVPIVRRKITKLL